METILRRSDVNTMGDVWKRGLGDLEEGYVKRGPEFSEKV